MIFYHDSYVYKKNVPAVKRNLKFSWYIVISKFSSTPAEMQGINFWVLIIENILEFFFQLRSKWLDIIFSFQGIEIFLSLKQLNYKI